MATRGYQPVYKTFQYDHARDGGGIGFIPLGQQIPVGFGIIATSCHVITSFAGAAATVEIGGSVDGGMTLTPVTATDLDAGDLYWMSVGRGVYSTALQTIGIEVAGGNITGGKGVFIVTAFVIIEP